MPAEPRFDLDLRFGKDGERFVHRLLSHIYDAPTRVEVKSDRQCGRTGRLYVEYECLRADGQWHKSGIAATEADLYAFVLGADTGATLILPTEGLRQMVRKLGRDARNRKEETDGSHPTKGIVFSLADVPRHVMEFPFL